MADYKEMNWDEVCKYLNDNNADFCDISQPLFKSKYMANAVYDITIEYGDWKHSHGYLQYLMEEKGYFQTRDDIIANPDLEGSDCYSSVHRFVFKPYYEFFNGKVKKMA